MAVELQGLGLIEKIFPVFIGNLDDTTSEYSNYFGSGCHPKLSEVSVKSVEEKLRYHTESQALGTPLVPDHTVKSVLDAITACQGAFIVGPADATFAAAAASIVKMLTDVSVTQSPRGGTHIHQALKDTIDINTLLTETQMLKRQLEAERNLKAIAERELKDFVEGKKREEEVDYRDLDEYSMFHIMNPSAQVRYLSEKVFSKVELVAHNYEFWFYMVFEAKPPFNAHLDPTADLSGYATEKDSTPEYQAAYAKLCDRVEGYVKNDNSLAYKPNNQGLVAVKNARGMDMRERIRSLVLWHGRYMTSEDRPTHQSATCLVFKATDVETEEPVALKLMRRKDQYDREIEQRSRLDVVEGSLNKASEYVVLEVDAKKGPGDDESPWPEGSYTTYDHAKEQAKEQVAKKAVQTKVGQDRPTDNVGKHPEAEVDYKGLDDPAKLKHLSEKVFSAAELEANNYEIWFYMVFEAKPPFEGHLDPTADLSGHATKEESTAEYRADYAKLCDRVVDYVKSDNSLAYKPNNQGLVAVKHARGMDMRERIRCVLPVFVSKEFAEKFHLIVMPLADKNLYDAFKSERWAGKNMGDVRHVFIHLVTCVQYMHDKGVLHADLKTMNIIRSDGQWKLIDFDAACEIGKKSVGHKSSSAYVPPEAIYLNEDVESLRKELALAKTELPLLSAGDNEDPTSQWHKKKSFDQNIEDISKRLAVTEAAACVRFEEAEVPRATLRRELALAKIELAKTELNTPVSGGNASAVDNADLISKLENKKALELKVEDLSKRVVEVEAAARTSGDGGRPRVRSVEAMEKWKKGEAKYELLKPHPSFDVWSLGCILYQMCNVDVKPLFEGGREDNLVDDLTDDDNLFALAAWSNELKEKKLARVTDEMARNLLSQMLHKDPMQRPSLARVLAHPFLSERKVARLFGEKPKYDVFLSYRVAPDSNHVSKLYDLLTAAPYNLSVYRDANCLKSGVDWEQGFIEGVVSSRAFVPLLSRDAINNPIEGKPNFSKVTLESPVDNVLLEYRMAVELQGLGLIEYMFPVFIGNKDDTTEEYSKYFECGCHPSSPDVAVKSVEEKLLHHMESQALGTPLVPNRTVKSVMGAVTTCQGAFVVGALDQSFNKIAATIHKMLKDTPENEAPPAILMRKSSTTVMTPRGGLHIQKMLYDTLQVKLKEALNSVTEGEFSTMEDMRTSLQALLQL